MRQDLYYIKAIDLILQEEVEHELVHHVIYTPSILCQKLRYFALGINITSEASGWSRIFRDNASGSSCSWGGFSLFQMVR